ncbi:MAG TPA: response regulator [Vicinamibacterales bacterium]|nr:response regulator [Vicinamibacterales bacterium]
MNGSPAEAETPSNDLVLVVEDETAVRSFCCAVLRRFGYRVLEAAGPVEALETLQQLPGPVSLVLTDVTMPGMNGKEMVRRIDREQLPNLKVLYMSGYTENIEPGVDLLEKPFTSADLLRRVRAALDKSTT